MLLSQKNNSCTLCVPMFNTSFVNTIFMIASCAYVFFQMRACVVMPEWRRCLTITTLHLRMLRLSLQDRLFAVTADSVWKERVVSTNLAFLVPRRSTARVYRLFWPQQTTPHVPWTLLTIYHVIDSKRRWTRLKTSVGLHGFLTRAAL